jgi:ATP synthase protein I
LNSSYIYSETMDKKKIFDYKKNRPWAEDLQIISQLGLTMVGCIAFCFFVGLYLGEWIGLKGFFVTIFTILGVIGGGVVVYRQIMETFEDKDHQNGRD